MSGLLRGLTTLLQLHPPRIAKKWLILGHVASPPHWTLIEVRWRDRKIYFYDSFAREGGYASDLERKTRLLLHLCEEHYEEPVDAAAFEWVAEKVCRGCTQVNPQVIDKTCSAWRTSVEWLGLRAFHERRLGQPVGLGLA